MDWSNAKRSGDDKAAYAIRERALWNSMTSLPIFQFDSKDLPIEERPRGALLSLGVGFANADQGDYRTMVPTDA